MLFYLAARHIVADFGSFGNSKKPPALTAQVAFLNYLMPISANCRIWSASTISLPYAKQPSRSSNRPWW